MPDFSVILQSDAVRPLVQQGLLERAFHDALFPKQLFRSEATPEKWPGHIGDEQIFSAPGLIPPKMKPSVPGVDPTPKSYPTEQWTAQLQQYDDTIDTHMPTSAVAIADLFLRNTHQLGMQAGQSLNRVVRNRMYNAALSGWTVADGAQNTVTTLRVKRLNGFTRARNPNLSGAGSAKVRFNTVSSSNPLAIIVNTGAATAVNVTGYTPDTAGDEYGPGTLTVSAAVTVADRAYVYAVDSTNIIRSGGGNRVDDVAGDPPTLADIRSMVAKFRTNNVPEHADGRFHAHLDPNSEAMLFADDELQRLLTALPDHYMYQQFVIGSLLGTIFLRNSECPIVSTVTWGSTATWSDDDPFAGELTTTGAAGAEGVHRILFSGQGGIFEYYSDLMELLTDAGVTGKVGEFSISNNGIEVMTDRVQLVIRAPINRTQDMVASTWKIIADWPARTDSATGDAARFKRFGCIEHGEGT